MKKKLDLSLYLVTHRGNLPFDEFLVTIDQAIQGGVTLIQLREKEITEDQFVAIGQNLKNHLIGKDIPLIINDSIEVAYRIGADGVHLGQSDKTINDARRILGEKAIIGLSVETLEQAEAAQNLDIDYIAASPVFSTPSKLDTAPPWELEGLKKLCEISKLPVIGIGGINSENIEKIMSTGVKGVAIISAIFKAQSPFFAAKELITKIRKVKVDHENFSNR